MKDEFYESIIERLMTVISIKGLNPFKVFQNENTYKWPCFAVEICIIIKKTSVEDVDLQNDDKKF